MKNKYQRLKLVITLLLLISSAVYLILKNFNENIVFFYNPTELKTKKIENTLIRIGGMVVKNSIRRNAERTEFLLTDFNQEIKIIYIGILPSLFREGQGIVAKGVYKEDVFFAQELLAKHDENYMPKEIAESLKKGECPSCR